MDPITLTLALHRQGASIFLEITHQDPRDQAQVAPLRAEVFLDPEALLPLQNQPAAYGAALSTQLLPEGPLQTRFLEIEARAGGLLRISLHIDPSALDLHTLRWELLQHPQQKGRLLAGSERSWFSRFMVTRDWRPVQLRAREQVRAVVAVAAPPAAELAKMRLAPVDAAGEEARARRALTGIPVQVVPATLEALVQAAKETDILYLVCHGGWSRQEKVPFLVLVDEAGALQRVPAEELASRLGALLQAPRLVVLASCESAGEELPPQATLAARLADAGVPAILAMQGKISMATVEKMMPVFFRELMEDGQIDRALAVARASVQRAEDAWMPALFLRLKRGRIWYTAGFDSSSAAETWKKLVGPVQSGQILPLLGPGMLEHVYGSASIVARNMAGKVGFPLPPYEWDDLPRVTQFIAVKDSRKGVIRAYKEQLVENMRRLHAGSLAGRPAAGLSPTLATVYPALRENDPAEPFQLIADLKAPLYILTNFDPILAMVLKKSGQSPQRVLSLWRYQNSPVEDNLSLPKPTRSNPWVYHAFGAFGNEEEADNSLVLTEDDYFDYLMQRDLVTPQVVESAMVNNSLLFLGFRLTDWAFRALFRMILKLEGKKRLMQHAHVAVQVDPDLHSMADVEGARKYLADYFKFEAKVDIFWGTPREFLRQLKEEVARQRPVEMVAPVDDGWDCGD